MLGCTTEQNPQVLPEAWSFLFTASQLSPSQKALAFAWFTCYRVAVGTSQFSNPWSQKGKNGFCHFSVTREGEPRSPNTQTKLLGLFIYQR